MKRLLFALASLLFLPFACVTKSKKTPQYDGVHYFKSWATYHIPYRPIGKISKEEAEKLESYYIGYYDNNLLVKFEKYLNNELNWRNVFTYWPNTKILQKREMFHFDPTVEPHRVQNFDQKGNIIKE